MQSILSATRVSIRVRVPEKKGRILIRPRRCAGAARGAAQQALAAASTNASSSLPTPAAVPDPSISIPQSSRETTSTVGVAPAQPPASCRSSSFSTWCRRFVRHNHVQYPCGVAAACNILALRVALSIRWRWGLPSCCQWSSLPSSCGGGPG